MVPRDGIESPAQSLNRRITGILPADIQGPKD